MPRPLQLGPDRVRALWQLYGRRAHSEPQLRRRDVQPVLLGPHERHGVGHRAASLHGSSEQLPGAPSGAARAAARSCAARGAAVCGSVAVSYGGIEGVHEPPRQRRQRHPRADRPAAIDVGGDSRGQRRASGTESRVRDVAVARVAGAGVTVTRAQGGQSPLHAVRSRRCPLRPHREVPGCASTASASARSTPGRRTRSPTSPASGRPRDGLARRAGGARRRPHRRHGDPARARRRAVRRAGARRRGGPERGRRDDQLRRARASGARSRRPSISRRRWPSAASSTAPSPWRSRQIPRSAPKTSSIPVVAECDDSWLSDAVPVQVEAADVGRRSPPRRTARSPRAPSAQVRAWSRFGFKAGIGTASRVVPSSARRSACSCSRTSASRRELASTASRSAGRSSPDAIPAARRRQLHRRRGHRRAARGRAARARRAPRRARPRPHRLGRLRRQRRDLPRPLDDRPGGARGARAPRGVRGRHRPGRRCSRPRSRRRRRPC